MRLSAKVLLIFYALLGTLLVWALNLSWSDFTLVGQSTQFDRRALRYWLVHQDTASARLSARAEHAGIHLQGGGFRSAGVGLFVRGETIFVEADCALDVPHVHPDRFRPQEAEVVFAAKRGATPASATVSVSTGFEYRYGPSVTLEPDWREYRINMKKLGPGNQSFVEMGQGSSFLMLKFAPPNLLDVWVRDLRVVRVPAPEEETKP